MCSTLITYFQQGTLLFFLRHCPFLLPEFGIGMYLIFSGHCRENTQSSCKHSCPIFLSVCVLVCNQFAILSYLGQVFLSLALLHKLRLASLTDHHELILDLISGAGLVNFVFTKWLRPTHVGKKCVIFALNSLNLHQAPVSIVYMNTRVHPIWSTYNGCRIILTSSIPYIST